MDACSEAEDCDACFANPTCGELITCFSDAYGSFGGHHGEDPELDCWCAGCHGPFGGPDDGGWMPDVEGCPEHECTADKGRRWDCWGPDPSDCGCTFDDWHEDDWHEDEDHWDKPLNCPAHSWEAASPLQSCSHVSCDELAARGWCNCATCALVVTE